MVGGQRPDTNGDFITMNQCDAPLRCAAFKSKETTTHRHVKLSDDSCTPRRNGDCGRVHGTLFAS
jgi:hypothetical protein